MEIIVIEAFMAHGKRVEPGDVIDLPVADAAYVIGLRRAQKVEAADKAESKPKKPAKK